MFNIGIEGIPYQISVEAVQVKEKYGGLRFYTNYSDSYIDGAISLAESLSLKTCETCGGQGAVIQRQGFLQIQTTCPRCQGKGTMISNPCTTCRGSR